MKQRDISLSLSDHFYHDTKYKLPHQTQFKMEMTFRSATISILFLFFFYSYSNARQTIQDNCPCVDDSLCDTIQEQRREVFGFVVNSTSEAWTKFDWTKLTTIVFVNFYDPDLYCYAHQHKVRVVFLASYSSDILRDDGQMETWISDQVSFAKSHFFDGINIDFEDELAKGSAEVASLTQFVNETTNTFHEAIPGSQVSFDVPFSPYNEKGEGVDGRNYDFKSLSHVTDFLFIMSYDHSSQVFAENEEECFAQANSNFYFSVGGMMAFLRQGIPALKLVFGQPWYGYDYPCIRFRGGEAHKCWIDYKPFRGVNCSDAIGQQRSYSDIVTNYSPIGTNYYDDHSKEYSVTYLNKETNQTHLIWYDTSYSYNLKYQTVEMLGLRGVGIWHLNHLNYSRPQDVKELWSTLPKYDTSIEI